MAFEQFAKSTVSGKQLSPQVIAETESGFNAAFLSPE